MKSVGQDGLEPSANGLRGDVGESTADLVAASSRDHSPCANHIGCRATSEGGSDAPRHLTRHVDDRPRHPPRRLDGGPAELRHVAAAALGLIAADDVSDAVAVLRDFLARTR
jgi:hypothetical protein